MGLIAWTTVAVAACDSADTRVNIFNPNASGAGDGGSSESSGGDDPAGDPTLTTGADDGAELDAGDDDGDDGVDADDGMQTSGPADDGPGNVCGDNVKGGDEACDGTDLAGQDCTQHGFDDGELKCRVDCSGFVSLDCITFECGNGVVEGEEPCDGADLAGEDCLSLGYDGGELGCKADCSAFEHHLCITANCGDDVVEGLELCDGSELSGNSCDSLGFNGGTLSCSETCTAFDSSACVCAETDIGGALGAVVASGSTAGEDDTLAISCAMGGGADRIVSFTAPTAGEYIFETVDSEYDTAIAAFDSCDFTSEIACNDDAAGQQSQINVMLAADQTVLIAIDGYGGDTGEWVLNINAGTDSCVETVVTAVGSPAAAGNTTQQDEDIAQSCASGGSVDHMIRFVAPSTGTFNFNTFGSGFDTALAAYTSCDPDSELVCNDDAGGGTQSQISLGMMAGQSVLVAVSGYNDATGNWVLNIAAG